MEMVVRYSPGMVTSVSSRASVPDSSSVFVLRSYNFQVMGVSSFSEYSVPRLEVKEKVRSVSFRAKKVLALLGSRRVGRLSSFTVI